MAIHILSFLEFAQAGVLKTVHKLFFKGVLKPRKCKNKSGYQIIGNLKPHHFHYGILTTFFSMTFPILILFLDSAKAGLLKNVQKHLSRCFGSREMSKTKVGTFF